MKLRNASADGLELRLPELTLTAAPDEVIEVPDEVYARYDWPSYWTEAGPSKKTVKES